MGRKPFKSPDEKLAVVLSVRRGETTQVAIARKVEMSQTTIAQWQKQFLEGGREALAGAPTHDPVEQARGGAGGSGRRAHLRHSVRPTSNCGCGVKGGSLPSYADLEEERRQAGISVARFCARLGIPKSTWYYYWRGAHAGGREVRRWPAPVVDQIEAVAAAKAEQFSAWDHRKIWAMLRVDGVQVSQASVKRAMARRGLLIPIR